MPNKTLYVKDSDLPMFERAQEQLGGSISSAFAEFLRGRLAELVPAEERIVELIHQIAQSWKKADKDSRLPGFLHSEYMEAEAYAEKALKSFERGEIRKAKVFFYAANVYREKAQRDLKDARELRGKIAEMLKTR